MLNDFAVVNFSLKKNTIKGTLLSNTQLLGKPSILHCIHIKNTNVIKNGQASVGLSQTKALLILLYFTGTKTSLVRNYGVLGKG